MTAGIPSEVCPGETRVAVTPSAAARLVKLGAEVRVEAGAGSNAGFRDEEYVAAGATLTDDRPALVMEADLILRVRPPPADEIERLQPGAFHLSFLNPFAERDLVDRLAARGVSAMSLELVPRTTRAQKMDVLTSQASLAGYVAVVLAAAHLPRIFPMMMTAAGTLTPARVLIIGAGVAGLQAIATARRLGATVEAYDTRPEVEEQIRSLGARCLKIDLGETGGTRDGYARALSQEQLQSQRQALQRAAAAVDIVITAAQVFGRCAPILVTAEMQSALRPGTVVVDLAVESGGNVEGVPFDRITVRDSVTFIALANPAGRVPSTPARYSPPAQSTWWRNSGTGTPGISRPGLRMKSSAVACSRTAAEWSMNAFSKAAFPELSL